MKAAGKGNWYARFGATKAWITREERILEKEAERGAGPEVDEDEDD